MQPGGFTGRLEPQQSTLFALVDADLAGGIEGNEVTATGVGGEDREPEHEHGCDAERQHETGEPIALGAALALRLRLGGRRPRHRGNVVAPVVELRRGVGGDLGGEARVGAVGRVGLGVLGERVGDDLLFTGVVEVVVAPDRHHVELHRGVGWIVALEYVEHDDRDVVAAAGCVGGIDEALGRGRRIFGMSGDDGGDLVVVDLVDQPVAAQHEPVAADDRHRPRVDPHTGLDPERPGDDVAAGVEAGLGAGDRTLGDEFLHEAVVDRDLAQAAVAEHVAARVADVGDPEHLARRCGRRSRRWR